MTETQDNIQESETDSSQLPQPESKPAKMNTSSIMEMLKNPFVLAMLKKNPGDVKDLINSFGQPTASLAMTYIQTSYPDLYAALHEEEQQEDDGEDQDDDDDRGQQPRNILDVDDEEYQDIIQKTYKLWTERGLTNDELSDWILKEYHVFVSPYKVKAALAHFERNLPEDAEPQIEKKPQRKPIEKRGTTGIYLDLLEKKRVAEEEVMVLRDRLGKKEEKQIGLIRKFLHFIW